MTTFAETHKSDRESVSLSKCFVILEGILSLEGILRNAPAFSRGVFSHPQNASETATEKNPTTAGLIFVLQLLKNKQKIADKNKKK